MTTRDRSRRFTTRRLLGAALGFLLGLLAGLAVTLALVVARAAAFEIYLEDVDEVLGWLAAPAVVVALLSVWLGLSGRLVRPSIGAGLGLGAGAGIGAALGALATTEPSGSWAGGVIGAGVGMLIGGGAAGIRAGHWAERRLPQLPPRTWVWTGVATVLALALGGALLVLGTRSPMDEPIPAAGSLPPADTASVESVVLLVGDPGQATLATHPTLVRLQHDVEQWSRALGPEGHVVVVYLGDIVYPNGLSAPDDADRATDSTRVADQVAVVGGPPARAAGARAVFLMGNHDWGERPDWGDAVRVHRLGEFIARRRAEGAQVSVEPAPGTGGPTVLDVGGHVRLLLLDTAWWLVDAEEQAKAQVIAGVEGALTSAGGRSIVIAAHHPFVSGGRHGALAALGSTLGLRTLLSRSGALLQDLHSAPYRELRRRLLEVFGRTGPPALFAGGHDHSLQVVRSSEPNAPPMNVISGSASKLSGTGPMPGTLFARSLPGYAVLLVHRTGDLSLRVEAAPDRYLSCVDPSDGAAAGALPSGDRNHVEETETSCLREGVAAFRTVWTGPV